MSTTYAARDFQPGALHVGWPFGLTHVQVQGYMHKWRLGTGERGCVNLDVPGVTLTLVLFRVWLFCTACDGGDEVRRHSQSFTGTALTKFHVSPLAPADDCDAVRRHPRGALHRRAPRHRWVAANVENALKFAKYVNKYAI